MVVALAAIALGGAIDLQHRWKRDFYANREAKYRERIAWHRHKETDCRARESLGEPYPSSERVSLINRGLQGLQPSSARPFKWPLGGWDEEAVEHRFWSDRLGTIADGVANLRRIHERRLLFY